MVAERSDIHHMESKNKSTGVWIPEESNEIKNIVEVKIEHGADIFNPKEPDLIKVGDEVEYCGILESEYKIGIVEEIENHYRSNFRKYKVNGEWRSEMTYSIREVDEKDILYGTVMEEWDEGKDKITTTSDEIDKWRKVLEEQENDPDYQIVLTPPLIKKIKRLNQAVVKEPQTSIEEDMMDFLLD